MLPKNDTVLLIKTFDVAQRKEILAKKFYNYHKDAIRRYADFLLETYTGKQGRNFSSKLAFVGRRNKGDAKQTTSPTLTAVMSNKLVKGTILIYLQPEPRWTLYCLYIV